MNLLRLLHLFFLLKLELHKKNICLVLGQDIIRRHLSAAKFASNSCKISKRQLRRTAVDTLKTVKVANSIARTLVNVEGNLIKSRYSKEDVVIEVLDLMFVKLNGKP